MTLLESLNKRCVFLEHAIGLIGLSNVKVVRGRAEVCFSAIPLGICVTFIYCMPSRNLLAIMKQLYCFIIACYFNFYYVRDMG